LPIRHSGTTSTAPLTASPSPYSTSRQSERQSVTNGKQLITATPNLREKVDDLPDSANDRYQRL
jgi:hypothetical protein